MNKYVLQLLKKFAGIDIDELQAEFNRVQGENVKFPHSCATLQIKSVPWKSR